MNDAPVCRGCTRRLFRRRRWMAWRDGYGHRSCAYRLAGFGMHKPGGGTPARIGSPAEPAWTRLRSNGS